MSQVWVDGWRVGCPDLQYVQGTIIESDNEVIRVVPRRGRIVLLKRGQFYDQRPQSRLLDYDFHARRLGWA